MKTNQHLALLLNLLIVSSSCLHAQTAWHLRHPLPSPGGVWGGGLFGVTYGNGQFVAVGYGGTVLTSTNAVTWTSRLPESDGNIYDVAYGNGKFVAVGGGDFLFPYLAPRMGGIRRLFSRPQTGRPGRRQPTYAVLDSGDWFSQTRFLSDSAAPTRTGP